MSFTVYEVLYYVRKKETLSIQVHPGDEYSMIHRIEYGKTEMWYILDCVEGSYLCYGFNKEISKDSYRMNITKGDSIFIPAQNEVYNLSERCSAILTYIQVYI